MKKLNNFFVGFPLALGLLGFFWGGLWIIAMLFMILTGGFQVICAVLLFREKRFTDYRLNLYMIFTTLFFILLLSGNFDFIWIMPPLLAIFFTVILMIENEKKDENTI